MRADERDARPAPARTRARRRPPYVVVGGLLVAFVAVSHFIGSAHRDFPSSLPPMFVAWDPTIHPLIVVPLALGAMFVLSLQRLLRARRAAFLAAVVGFAFAGAVSLAIAGDHAGTAASCCGSREAPSALADPLERVNDYLRNVQVVQRLGPLPFARRYPRIARPVRGMLTIRADTHPPGAVLAVWALSGLSGERPTVTALLIVLIGSLGALPTYALAREVSDERSARLAAVLFATSPAVLLYTATAVDAVFMTVIATAMAALARAPRSATWAVAAGFLAAASLTLTYAALALAPVALGLWLLAGRTHPLRAVLLRAAVALVALLVVVGALRLAGIDLLACLRQASRIQQEFHAYRLRPFAYWAVGNVVAFLIAAGLGLTALLVAEAVRRWRAWRPGLETVAIATLLVASILGRVRGETEHIWLFLIPLVAAAAAPAAERVRGVAAAGLGQAAATQLLFFTRW